MAHEHDENCHCAICMPGKHKVPWQQKTWVVPMADGYQAELSIDKEFDITCFFRKPETKDATTGETIPEVHLAALAFRRGEACNLGLALLEATKDAGAAWAAHDLRTNPVYQEKK